MISMNSSSCNKFWHCVRHDSIHYSEKNSYSEVICHLFVIYVHIENLLKMFFPRKLLKNISDFLCLFCLQCYVISTGMVKFSFLLQSGALQHMGPVHYWICKKALLQSKSRKISNFESVVCELSDWVKEHFL